MRLASRFIAVSSVLVLTAAGAGASFAFVSAENPGKVDICHASNSAQNPYTTNQVDTSSVDLNGHVNHTGPIFTEGMEGGWGDIIPPVPDVLPNGLNWPEGEPTWLNGCNFVSPSPSPSPTPTPTETPMPTPETTVAPASPETPAPVDSDELLPNESVPVDIADPGALASEEEPVGIEPASPQQESVPTSVPAGGGAASSKR